MLFRRSFFNELSSQQEVRAASACSFHFQLGTCQKKSEALLRWQLGTLCQRKGFSFLLAHAVRKAQTTYQRFCVSIIGNDCLSVCHLSGTCAGIIRRQGTLATSIDCRSVNFINCIEVWANVYSSLLIKNASFSALQNLQHLVTFHSIDLSTVCPPPQLESKKFKFKSIPHPQHPYWQPFPGIFTNEKS